MDTSKITNVLIFKDGYYYLAIQESFWFDGKETKPTYAIVPEDWELKNGFEFASDAYAYLASLSPLREPRKNGIHLDMKEEIL